MRTSLVTKIAKTFALLSLAIAIAIVSFEYKRPSPKYWWRKVAESGLTKFSANTRKPIGLSASKLAFKLRRYASSPATIRQLADAAEQHGDYSLSAISKIYLARMSGARMNGRYEETSLQLAKEAFELKADELTAWQYATYLRHSDKPVPAEVTLVLLDGVSWEYSRLLRIDARTGSVSELVKASRAEIYDAELLQLADSTAQAEAMYVYWSRPEIQIQVMKGLHDAYADALLLAIEDRGEAFVANLVSDLVARFINGVTQLFIDPGPMEIEVWASRTGRRFIAALSAAEAIGTATTRDEQIVKAREALGPLERQMDYLESGEMVNGLEREMTSSKSALIARLDKLLSHPERYKINDILVLAAIEGRNPKDLFFSIAAKSGATY